MSALESLHASSDFDFPLPPELITQQPLADRAASRLLHLERASGKFTDGSFRDFLSWLRDDDLLVFNDSRVIPARLFGRRSGVHALELSENNPAAKDFLQGRIECLLTRRVGEK